MGSLQSLPTRGKSFELSEEGWAALVLRYMLAQSPGKERLRKSVGPKLAETFGVAKLSSKVVSTREGPTGQRTYRFSEISTTIWPVVGLHADEMVGHPGNQRAESHADP